MPCQRRQRLSGTPFRNPIKTLSQSQFSEEECEKKNYQRADKSFGIILLSASCTSSRAYSSKACSVYFYAFLCIPFCHNHGSGLCMRWTYLHAPSTHTCMIYIIYIINIILYMSRFSGAFACIWQLFLMWCAISVQRPRTVCARRLSTCSSPKRQLQRSCSQCLYL